MTKEARVLSGRSLLSLAREVEQGLTLAIHLHLTDSTITGMGFDALARGQSLADITYKVLLLWKRKTGRYKDLQVGAVGPGLRGVRVGWVQGHVGPGSGSTGSG